MCGQVRSPGLVGRLVRITKAGGQRYHRGLNANVQVRVKAELPEVDEGVGPVFYGTLAVTPGGINFETMLSPGDGQAAVFLARNEFELVD